MCGIAGYLGGSHALPILTSLLKRLEYRGYDSAGISLIDGQNISTWKREGDVEHLLAALPRNMPSAYAGIAHTRWATHGIPSDRNAHPLWDCHRILTIAHNGVIDNYADLRLRLSETGHHFESATDSEVVAHMMEDQLLQGIDPVNALAQVNKQLEGAFALVILLASPVPMILATRTANPMVVGIGEQGAFLSSDAPALHGYVTETRHLLENEIVSITTNSVEIGMPEKTFKAFTVSKSQQHNAASTNDPFDHGRYSHYMHKEIWEQTMGLSRMVEALSSYGNDKYRDLRAAAVILNGSTSAIVAGCGSSYLSGLVARYWMEDIAGLPVELDIASELAYRTLAQPQDGRRTPALLISQSGETADVLAALKALRKVSMPIIALTNTHDSELQRQADARLVTDMGPEIAVASTKTFTAQLVMLASLSIVLGQLRGRLSIEESSRLFSELTTSIQEIQAVLAMESKIRDVADYLHRHEQVFILGRHVDYALAQEAALKLREVAYVGAQGYAGAELKHGNLALFTPNTPAICIAVSKAVRTRMLGNIEEVRARGVPIVTITCKKSPYTDPHDTSMLELPCSDGCWSALPTIAALHLLTYHIAVLRGCPVDHPRNLAKSSTVQ